MKLLEVSGTNYEMGKQIGEAFKTSLNRKAKKLTKTLEDPLLYKKIMDIRKKLEKDFPFILEEINGKAEGAEIDKNVTLLMHSPELLWKNEGCSTAIMIDKENDVLFSHNEDERDFKKNETMIVKYVYEDHWVIGYTACDKVIGSCFGFNSYGLLFSSNLIINHGINTDYVSRYILQRYLTEANSISDLRKRLKDIEVASPFSFNVVDINKCKAYNFEKDLKKVVETKITDRYARANHFKTRKGEVNKSESSDFRDVKATELIYKLDREKVKLKDVKKIMDYKTKNHNKSILLLDNDKNVSQTVANLTYSTKENIAIITDYLGNMVYEYYLSL